MRMEVKMEQGHENTTVSSINLEIIIKACKFSFFLKSRFSNIFLEDQERLKLGVVMTICLTMFLVFNFVVFCVNAFLFCGF